MDNQLYGGIEAGGTKFICAVGTAPDNIISKTEIATTSPHETLGNVIEFFGKQPKLRAMGIASFGPLDIDKQSQTYGYITSTPKEGWRNTDLVGTIARQINVPISLDSDVNAAALAEQQYGAGKGLKNIAYMTVGTGIGVGCIVDDKILSGLIHTEMGHMLIPFSAQDTNPVSVCPYHDNCLEGLASGTAIRKRWNVLAEKLNNDEAWDLEAYYLSLGVVNVISCVTPMRIIIGGGVIEHVGLIEAIRLKIPKINNGYLQFHNDLKGIEDYILKPQLGNMSGVCGAIAIAIKVE